MIVYRNVSLIHLLHKLGMFYTSGVDLDLPAYLHSEEDAQEIISDHLGLDATLGLHEGDPSSENMPVDEDVVV